MSVLSHLLNVVATIVNIALNLYILIIIARAVLSWVNPDPYNPIVNFITRMTEPVLYRVRRLLPYNFGGIDFSPIIVIFLVYFVEEVLVSSIHGISDAIAGTGAWNVTFIIGYFFKATANMVHSILILFLWLVIIRAVLSWVNPDPYNMIVRFIYNATEPILYKLRTKLPLYYGDIDFSPMVLVAIIYLLDQLLVNILFNISRSILL